MSQFSPQEPVVSFDELSAKRYGRIRRFLRGHPKTVNLLTAGIFLSLALLGMATSAAVGEEDSAWAILVVTAITACLLVRTIYPMTVLALVFVLDTSSILINGSPASFTGFGMMIALYTAGSKYPGRRIIPLAVLATAFQMVLLVLVGYPDAVTAELDDGRNFDDYGTRVLIIAVSTGTVLASYIAAAAIGSNVRNGRLHEAELNHWASQVSRLAQVQERNRIAREMHDVVAHSLSVMIALAEGARVVSKRDAQRADEVLGELTGTGRAALADMRRMLGVLRSNEGGELAPQPTGGSLQQLVEGFRVAGLPLTYTHSGPALPGEATFQLTVYRIVQESLTNALRYAREATKVTVDIERTGRQVRINVRDDGRSGQEGSVGAGQGLRGMRERAALFDGQVQAGPAVNGGWVVNVSLVVPDEAEQPGK